MKTNFKLKLLIGYCFLIIGTLSMIQYYLVQNTYKLTKEKYYAEVIKEIGKITHSPSDELIEETAQENLKYIVRLYSNKKLPRKDLRSTLNKRNDSLLKPLILKLNRQMMRNDSLKDIRYKSQYDEIILTRNGRADTLVSTDQKPFVLFGHFFDTPNTLLISNGNNIIIDNPPGQSGENNNTAIRLEIRRSQYIDASSLEREVFKRMAGIYLLAVLLIIAVIILFYLVFSGMIRQKKLAEIKTDFANNITHELKTPLSSVNLILKTLEKTDIQSNRLLTDELLQTLKRQHNKIQQTVDYVLESAMETLQEIEKQPINISSYLNQYAKDMYIEDHTLETDINPAVKPVPVNMNLLDKILNNLIENAVKYSPPGSIVHLNGYQSGDHYLIEVADNGPGISPANQPHIFDKFFRVPERNKHTVKGLGLGLHLSKQAAIAMGGNLTLQSPPGSGCVFTLKLVL